ncbi:MAG TPA: phosphoribosylformylglycinamidine synthase [Solibacterales bacterium]|jgi:phosphoribosylformylglycinamidine synthase|nr:phosphoribosylformylglycinamidine synthase [Bryobacterales bacterium]
MKARVYVFLKSTVLDPQGQAVRNALAGLGHTGVADVRQGKVFDIMIEPGTDVESIAREVLTNPVVEEYRIEYPE